MSCLKARYLIQDIREEVEDQEISASIGMPDSSYLLHLNDALSRIHSLIINKHPRIFTEEVIESVGKSTAYIDIPVDAFMGNKLVDVKYSTNNKDWAPMPRLDKKRDVRTGQDASLIGYYHESEKLKLVGRPEANSYIKYTYVKKVPKLSLKVASVGSVTLDTVNRTITSLTLDTVSDILDNTALSRNTRLCVVDYEGNIKMQNIPYTTYNTSSGVVTVAPGFVYLEGQTIDVGDTVVVGAYASDTPLINDYVEKYLISYATMKMLQRDGSVEVSQQSSVLLAMEQEIVEAYSSVSDDINLIPDIQTSNRWDNGY